MGEVFADLCRAACCPDGCTYGDPPPEWCIADVDGKRRVSAVLRRQRVPSEDMKRLVLERAGLDPDAQERDVLDTITVQGCARTIEDFTALIDHLIAEGERRG